MAVEIPTATAEVPTTIVVVEDVVKVTEGTGTEDVQKEPEWKQVVADLTLLHQRLTSLGEFVVSANIAMQRRLDDVERLISDGLIDAGFAAKPEALKAQKRIRERAADRKVS